MRNRFLLCLSVAACALFCFTNSGFSYPVSAGDKIIITDSYGTTGGGEFIVDPQNPNTNESFITFCLEITEYFTPGLPITVKAVTDYAEYNGNLPSTGFKDYISDQTAWLYYSFVTKTLNNYDFYGTGDTRVASANSLQYAIWLLEEEITATSDAQALLWIQEANAAYNSGWRNDGRVAVMNLATFTIETPKQDMLVATPEPISMLLFGTGLFGIGGYMRRKFRN